MDKLLPMWRSWRAAFARILGRSNARNAQRIEKIVQDWAGTHGARFEWTADREITYTGSRGAWHLSTQDINGHDDWISVHPTANGCELQKVASAGHVEVLKLTPEELETALADILAWFEGWRSFMSFGPGKGH